MTRTLGKLAEDRAAVFLQRQGLELVERNYQCRFGEIDLILRDRGVLVFAEVRSRGNQRFGGAAASITPSKRHKLTMAARHYLSGKTSPPPCRFDAVLIAGEEAPIEWLKNIFDES